MDDRDLPFVARLMLRFSNRPPDPVLVERARRSGKRLGRWIAISSMVQMVAIIGGFAAIVAVLRLF